LSGTNRLNGGNWVAGVRVSLPFEIGNLVQGKNPFAGAGDAFKFGKRREFKERLGETVWRSHREQTTVGRINTSSGNSGANTGGNPTPTLAPTSPSTPSPTPAASPSRTPTPTPTPIQEF
jgi:hypothetical protein